MEERKIALWVLGIIVVLGIVGLFSMFNAEKTGAGFVASKTYPAIGKYGAYSNENPFPYYTSTYGVSPMELPGYQNRVTYQHDWAWRSNPDNTYVAKMGRCAILATPEIGKVPAGYIMDATWNQATYQYGMANCIKEDSSQNGWCCKRTSSY
ncbi:hypothetical protein KY338_07000 [Candidatus Woesearchaeota archaeon]|nr:hypothetical protein [Candidatus Woesearchaeota archaeon]MBW3005393.1 hypothetical protein [Candidatus Woesearchaeota archaeon]